MLGEQRSAALQDAAAGGAQREPHGAGGGELATAPDAVVVCGYGEMGQRACDVLADAEAGHPLPPSVFAEEEEEGGGGLAGWGTTFIAFDRNPSRIAVGLAKQVRVVYGDGASPELLRAAGILRPRAIVVTYANDKRRLERQSSGSPRPPVRTQARLLRLGAASSRPSGCATPSPTCPFLCARGRRSTRRR